MARVDPKAYDPDRYDAVKKDQEEIRRKCRGIMTMVRICPYCGFRIEQVARGTHTCVPHPISTCLEQYAVIYGAKELWINDCHLVWTIRTPCGMYGT